MYSSHSSTQFRQIQNKDNAAQVTTLAKATLLIMRSVLSVEAGVDMLSWK